MGKTRAWWMIATIYGHKKLDLLILMIGPYSNLSRHLEGMTA